MSTQCIDVDLGVQYNFAGVRVSNWLTSIGRTLFYRCLSRGLYTVGEHPVSAPKLWMSTDQINCVGAPRTVSLRLRRCSLHRRKTKQMEVWTMAVRVGGLNVRLVLWFTAENIRCRPDSQTGMHQDPLGPPAPPTSWRAIHSGERVYHNIKTARNSLGSGMRWYLSEVMAREKEREETEIDTVQTTCDDGWKTTRLTTDG